MANETMPADERDVFLSREIRRLPLKRVPELPRGTAATPRVSRGWLEYSVTPASR